MGNLNTPPSAPAETSSRLSEMPNILEGFARMLIWELLAADNDASQLDAVMSDPTVARVARDVGSIAFELIAAATSAQKDPSELGPASGEETYPGGISVEQVRELRTLYCLDHPKMGICFDAHTMSRPSTLARQRQNEALDHWRKHGVAGWQVGAGNFTSIEDGFRTLVAELVGADPKRVLHGPHATGLHRDILLAVENPVVAYARDHFSSIFKMMGEQEAATQVDFHDPDFELPKGTNVVMVSHAGYKTGIVHPLPELVAKIRAQAPKALIIIDAYQTAGTVPIDLRELGGRVAIVGGGHKQLASAAGPGFAAFGEGTLEFLEARYPGWWAEQTGGRMWGYEDAPVQIDDPDSAVKLQTGSRDFFAHARLVAELEILRSLGGGDIQNGIQVIRAKSLHQLALLRERLEALGLTCLSPQEEDRIPAYLVFEHSKAEEITQALGERGVQIDSRGTKMRISVNKATTDAEILRGCEIMGEVLEALN